jgi:hypothetical protein
VGGRLHGTLARQAQLLAAGGVRSPAGDGRIALPTADSRFRHPIGRLRPARAAGTRPSRRLTKWWPPVLGAAWVALLLAPLLVPGRILANRDILLFHLPLRACLRALAARATLPVWNPWLNGGQPLLSNPSYAAFYPPTWLTLPLPPQYALTVVALLHAAIAFAGAWRLARHLGAGRGAAALAAVAYTGCGALLSLLNAYTLFCSMAWFPWVLAFGDAALRCPAGPARAWLKPALLAAMALGLQLLNGEPSTVMVSGLGLLALAVAALVEQPAGAARRLWRVLVPPLAAVAIAAVQLVPTAGRLAVTSRSGGLSTAEATKWSAPPERLVELALPRFFGDPTRQAQGLYFGHGVDDMDYPYVVSIYPGLLITLLAAAAMTLWPVPRRAAWIACAFTGAFLALGRHNPLYEPLRHLLPPLAVQRYPERFGVLAIAPLAFAAALGWQHLLDRRRAGGAAAADLPLALALLVLAFAAALTGVLYAAPAVGLVFLRDHGLAGASVNALARALVFLRHEGWAAIATAAAVAALLALCRWRRPHPALLSALAVALAGADLWHYGHGLVRTVPEAEIRSPPPWLAELVSPPGARLFVETTSDEREILLAGGDVDQALARASLARLTPYSAAIWQVPYAANYDYDRMLTHWGEVTLRVLHAELAQKPEMAVRLLGAWGVAGMLLRASTAAGQPEVETPPQPAVVGAAANVVPRRAVRNRFSLPIYRFVPRVSFHPTYASALYLARAQGYALDRHEHCVRAAPPPTPPAAPTSPTSPAPAATMSYPAPPKVLTFEPGAGRLALRYRAPQGGFFVAAMTFDDGWRAEVDGARRTVYATAAGQLGVELPPGEHGMVLAYRDPLLAAGAAVSLAALAAWAMLVVFAAGPLKRTTAAVAGPPGTGGGASPALPASCASPASSASSALPASYAPPAPSASPAPALPATSALPAGSAPAAGRSGGAA